MSNRKPRYIVFDGGDALGKSTQLEIVKKLLSEQGLTIHHTRALGGDGTCDFQQAIRKTLLHKKFPTDQSDLAFEEKLFSMADNEGVRAAISFLDSNPNGIVLKDRGVASHVVYSQSRGMSNEQINHIHGKLFNSEKEISRHYGSLFLVFVPSNLDFPMKRLEARAKATGTEIVDRLENLEFQKKVTSGMSSFFLHPFSSPFTVETIMVNELDNIEAVSEKVKAVLKRYGYDL